MTMMLARMPKTMSQITTADNGVADAGSGILHRCPAHQGRVDKPTDDPRDEDDEGVNGPEIKGERHHVTVGDVRDLMRDHRLRFLARHALQRSRWKRRPANCAGWRRWQRRSVHRRRSPLQASANPPSPAPHGFEEPELGGVLRRLDHRAPVLHLASVFDIQSEMKAPPKSPSGAQEKQPAQIQPRRP